LYHQGKSILEDNMFQKTVYLIVILALALAACAPAAEAMPAKSEEMLDKPTEAMMEKPTEEMMEKPTEAMMDKPTEAMMDKATPEAMDDKLMAPEWFSVPLAEVSSGESFTIADFKGKVVLVENLAMWCPNCKKQQAQVKAVIEALGMRDDFVAVGLDIDPNENAADLKAYAESNGFGLRYAIAPAEVSRAMASLYGDQFLNPPSTPMLVIDRQGKVIPLPFGIKSSADLLAAIEPLL
jgi:thiol-disulfide isomerase/thioredoxin